MKVESRLLLWLGVFVGILAIVYLIWSGEYGGGVMLVGTCLLGLFPGLYYAFWHKRMGHRPEDTEEAMIPDGAGVVGTFPGSSIWPFVLGMGSWLMVMALVFGTWFAVPGIALIVVALAGGTAEKIGRAHV